MTATPALPLTTLADIRPIVARELRVMRSRVGSIVDEDDLESVGLAAAAKIIAATPSPLTPEFHSYCARRVRGAMLDEIRRRDPLSRPGRAQVKLLLAAVDTLEERNGRVPAADEIAAEMGIAADVVRAIEDMRVAAAVVQLDSLPAGALDAQEDKSAPSPAERLEVDELLAAMLHELATLNATQAHVVRRYFMEDSSLADIARELGISKVRVHQLRDRALDCLRRRLAAFFPSAD